MKEPQHDRLPDDIAAELDSVTERDALDTLWQALPAARSQPEVTASERDAMWAAIMAGTSTPADVRTAQPRALAASASSSAPRVERVRSPRSISAASTQRSAWASRAARPMAALAAVLLVTTIAVARPGAWQEIVVPRGEARAVMLPDSTRVMLNADSRLRYRTAFRGWFRRAATREVQLLGSGYFEVRRDGRPFVVATYNASVRVLGTAFSVDAWETDGTGTVVHVAEGKVAVAGAASGETVLQAGDRAIVSHGTRTAGPATRVAAERVAPWRDGGFAAIDEPLGAVLPAIARRYDVVVNAVDSSVAARRITLYVPEASADRLLGDIATMQGLVLERRRDGYVLRTP
ncbi:MAG: FecR domain-containing protein [Gemmatimonadaceae bacterium]|jgi:ferric-dicitrate binding protein FerR (iron transport regulator)|nr:FecR domain-containing protein [Gemmatimonadaceae bacterium]